MTRKLLACSVAAAALSLGVAHAAKTPVTINAGGSSLAFPTYAAEFAAYTKALFSYEAVGSGAGQKAFLNNDITFFEPASPTNPNGYAPGTGTYGTIVGTAVDIGASDATLSATQLTNPATGSYTGTNGSSAVDGPIIQIPTIGVPVTLAFNESGVTSSGLTLTDTQVCGVLSGKITDWNTLVPTIAAGTTIHVVVRSDGSGTTFLTTQHLHAVCNSSNSSFPVLPVPVTKYFYNSTGSSNPVFPSGLPANFVGESGSGNVAKELLGQLVGTQTTPLTDTIGYLSPDFTSIAPGSTNTTSLQVASLVNAVDGKTYAPNVTNTILGLANPGTGSTNPNPPATLAAAMNPLNWVPTLPVVNKGYPIVGYTTMDLSTCYASATKAKDIIGFLKDQYQKSGPYYNIITNNGFTPVLKSGAAGYVKAVSNIFLSNKSGYNLDINDATTCAGLAGR